MVIDLTAQLAPIGLALVATLVLSALGILCCVDERELPALRQELHAAREIVAAAVRRVLHVGRLPSPNRG